MYLNIKYVIATRSCEFLYIYAESHWKYHTFEGYYICSFSKLRHKAHQKLCKCSPTSPLRNGIVTIYENGTNNNVTVDKLGGRYPPPGCPRYLRYTFERHELSQQFIPLNVRKWTPNSYLKRQNFIPDEKSVTSKNLRGGWVPPPLVARRLSIRL